ncbi:acid phosphatase [Tomitella biformata]|uniref:acid phosphatase n=1 Tax=Tomitella biformata TaxID=630403 RepID=UPI000464C6F0|nr:acid phosphatase [Tomitella biformata]
MNTITKRVILLRHGETEWSATGRHTGRTDIPLTDLGIRQARSVAGHLDELDLRDPLVFASPRRRALDTAELAGLAPDRIDSDLAEWDYGDYEGRTTPQIRESAPGWTVFTQPCPGGESAADVGRRADKVLAALPAERDAILVGHGHFSRVLMARWLAQEVSMGAHLGMPAAGVAVLGYAHNIPLICSITGPRA